MAPLCSPMQKSAGDCARRGALAIEVGFPHIRFGSCTRGCIIACSLAILALLQVDRTPSAPPARLQTVVLQSAITARYIFGNNATNPGSSGIGDLAPHCILCYACVPLCVCMFVSYPFVTPMMVMACA